MDEEKVVVRYHRGNRFFVPSKRKSVAPKASRPYMPEYGIPKSTKGLLSWGWAEQRLRKSHNYWISTVKPDGAPHAMVVWGLWLNGAFYFSTGRKSRKAKNLAENPHCVIGTEKANEAVVVEGTAAITKDAAILKQFVTLYRKKYEWNMENFGEPVYVVTPARAFGLYEKKFMGSATRWEFGK